MVHFRNSLRIVSSLRLVKHDEMFRWRYGATPAVMRDVVLNGLDERATPAAGFLQGVLENLHQWPISGQIHGWGSRPTASSLHGEVIEPSGVNEL